MYVSIHPVLVDRRSDNSFWCYVRTLVHLFFLSSSSFILEFTVLPYCYSKIFKRLRVFKYIQKLVLCPSNLTVLQQRQKVNGKNQKENWMLTGKLLLRK